MLKMTLIATAAISAALLAAATLLPALAQPPNAAHTSTAANSAQPPVDAGLPDKQRVADDSSARKSNRPSGRSDRHGDEGHGASDGTNKAEERHSSRD